MKKKNTIIIVVVAFVVICTVFIMLMLNAGKIDKVMSNLETQTTSDVMNTESTLSTKSTTEKQTSVNKNYSYDDLQKIFLEITPETTLDDFLKILNKYNLSYSSQEPNNFNGAKNFIYKLAYDDEVAKLSHAMTGDHIEISFNKDKNLNYVTYFNANAWYGNDYKNIYQAVLYASGDYGQIQADKMDYELFGYYGEVQNAVNNIGLEIHYNNGNSAKTNLFTFDSAEAVINCIIDNSERYLQESNIN